MVGTAGCAIGKGVLAQSAMNTVTKVTLVRRKENKTTKFLTGTTEMLLKLFVDY